MQYVLQQANFSRESAGRHWFEPRTITGPVLPRAGDVITIDGAELEVAYVAHEVTGAEAGLPTVVVK